MKTIITAVKDFSFSEWANSLFSERDFDLSDLDNEGVMTGNSHFLDTPLQNPEVDSEDHPLFC